MGPQKEQILARLQDLVDLIDEVCALGSLPRETFSICLDSIINFTSLLNLPHQDTIKLDLIKISQSLLTTEQYFLKTILSHLKKAYDRHFDWNAPIIDSLSEETPLKEVLFPIISHYRALVVEKNKHYQQLLNEQKNKLGRKKFNRQDIIKQIDELQEKLEKYPTVLINIEELDSIKNQMRMKQKKKPKVVSIEEIPLDNILVALNAEISTRRNHFLELNKETDECIKNAPVIEPSLSKDFQLLLLSRTIEMKKTEAQALIDHQKQQIILLMQQRDYHQRLIDELTSTNEKLEKLNQEIKAISVNIIKRTYIIAPNSMDCEVLQLHQQIARDALVKQLEYFLRSFSVIELGDKNEPDTLYFSSALVKFVKTICQDLQNREMPTDKSKVNELRVKLLEHLGEKSTFFTWKTSRHALEENEVEQFIVNLFTSLHPDQSALTLKKQISLIYHVAAKLEAYPIKNIKDYHIYKNTFENQNEIILNSHGKLTTELTKFEQRFCNYLDLFPDSIVNIAILNHGRAYRNQLKKWQNQLNDNQVRYITQRDEALRIISPLKRLQKVTSIQENNVKSLQQLNDSLENDDNWITSTLSALEACYKKEKQRFITKLDDARENTEAALLVTEAGPKQVEILLKPFDLIYNKLQEENQTLDAIEHEVTVQLSELKKHFNYAINKLVEKKQIAVQETQQALNAYAPPVFSPENPLINSLKIHQKEALLNFGRLTTKNNQLKRISGKNLKKWSKEFDDLLLIVNTEIEYRNAALIKAREIERRLNSKEYLASVTVLTTLRHEFERILKNHIDNALQNFPDEQETLGYVKDKLLSDIDTGVFNFPDVNEALLNKIDPRLYKLLSMYLQFRAINNFYINQNTELLTDKSYYDLLLNNVTTHLHNTNMEKISDGVHSPFFQWIRTHIFKPLQAAKLSVKNRINGFFNTDFQPNQRIIPTIGASETELELIAMGNEAFESLVAGAA